MLSLIAFGLWLIAQSSPNLDPSQLSPEPYFPDSYVSARKDFNHRVQALKALDSKVQAFSHRVPSRIHEDLTVDSVYLPPRTRGKKLVILVSGIHGAEAIVGSALEFKFLDTLLPQIPRESLGLLLIHSLNPFGYRQRRRVTENNVDLNRNLHDDPKEFESFNEGYHKLNSFLNPEEPVQVGLISRLNDGFQIFKALLQTSRKEMRQAIVGGQYEFSKGIYFGGMAYEPQQKILDELIDPLLKDYEQVYMIDLHTGYGEKGRLHFIAHADLQGRSLELTQKVFESYEIDLPSDKDFFRTSGDLLSYVDAKVIRHQKSYIGMAFEFGTLDSQTLWGSIRSLQRLRKENQGFHYGYVQADDAAKVQGDFQDLFFPKDPNWRVKIMESGTEALLKTIQNFLKLE